MQVLLLRILCCCSSAAAPLLLLSAASCSAVCFSAAASLQLLPVSSAAASCCAVLLLRSYPQEYARCLRPARSLCFLLSALSRCALCWVGYDRWRTCNGLTLSGSSFVFVTVFTVWAAPRIPCSVHLQGTKCRHWCCRGCLGAAMRHSHRRQTRPVSSEPDAQQSSQSQAGTARQAERQAQSDS